ncbi:hypothetical protein psal_cds_1007 [Pandoravirus salinus]|uniref:Uncharacterized protein n=1 Tax=Pandoravirus salinus TaxID=1349410 RepID=A0A291AU08_9VIRU|nr:hypothetical protein psal_cds_1007 [Pandoravirus salinus]ATE82268.1 hypothetical protein psal_cds_1007 [Pandoravirus salinus]
MHRPRRRDISVSTEIDRCHPIDDQLARLGHEAFALLGHARGQVQVVPAQPAVSWTPWTAHGLVSAMPWRSSIGMTLSRLAHIPRPTGSAGPPEHEWAPIMAAAALTSDRWWLKGLFAGAVTAVAVGACASMAGARPLVNLIALQMPAGACALELINRHAIYRADDIIVDALAGTGLDGPLSKYIAQCEQGTRAHPKTTLVLPEPTGDDRVRRMRTRLAEKWNM